MKQLRCVVCGAVIVLDETEWMRRRKSPLCGKEDCLAVQIGRYWRAHDAVVALRWDGPHIRVVDVEPLRLEVGAQTPQAVGRHA